jgi:pseudaminic acid biosynthesis-associated methylase
VSIETEQTAFWSGDFGKEYTDRNSRKPEDWDQFYKDTYGISKLKINQALIGHLPKEIKILEVGCNTGMQLEGLQRMGFTNLYGVELQPYAVEKAKKYTTGINIIQGSGFDLPFRDEYFDLVCTNGVLIHIAPPDLKNFMAEMTRCSRQFIMGFEYYSKETEEIKYRGNENKLWKADYAGLFSEYFPAWKQEKKILYPYVQYPRLQDAAYLLNKSLS